MSFVKTVLIMRKLGELMTEILQRIVLKVWHHISQVVFLPQKMIY